MKEYVRPIVLASEDLAEGVYAASGAVSAGGSSSGTGSASVSAIELISEGNQWNKVNIYKVTIANTGSEDSAEWSVSVSVTLGTATGATVYNNWLASASLNGSKITITPGGGGTITAGGSIDVEVVVSYEGDVVIVK